MAIIDIKNVGFQDGDQTILEGITFSVESGDFVLLAGPSGSGKSSLLKLINDLQSPSEGQILFHGKDIKDYSPIELRRSISYCLQTPIFFGEKVLDDMEFVFASRGQELDKTRMAQVMEFFKLDPSYLEKEVINLSGGEKQRLALVRSLIFKPEVLLLDEVTSALDEDNALILESAIQSLNRDGLTVIWISHQVDRHRKLANKLVSLEAGRLVGVEVNK